MGGAAVPLDLAAQPPAVILLAGLQGAGKTTTAAQARAPAARSRRRRCLVVSADVYRPAAIDQLQTLAAQVGVDFFPSTAGEQPVAIAAGGARLGAAALPRRADRRHRGAARDRRGDDARDRRAPRRGEAGRDAVRRRRDAGPGRGQHRAAFRDALPLTGVILTKLDGDARGGAALSVRHVTGAPIKFAGVVREDRRPRGVPSRAHGVAHPRHGRRAVADRGRAQDGRRRGGAEARAGRSSPGKGFDLDDFKAQIGADAQDGRPRRRCWTSCRRSSRAPRRAAQRRRAQDRPHRGHHQLDDARPSARSPSSSRRRASGGSRPAPASRCRRSTSS